MKCVQLRTWSGGARGSFLSMHRMRSVQGPQRLSVCEWREPCGNSAVPSDLRGVPGRTAAVGVHSFLRNDTMRWRETVRRVVGANPL
jgi:hypothetical protein